MLFQENVYIIHIRSSRIYVHIIEFLCGVYKKFCLFLNKWKNKSKNAVFKASNAFEMLAVKNGRKIKQDWNVMRYFCSKGKKTTVNLYDKLKFFVTNIFVPLSAHSKYLTYTAANNLSIIQFYSLHTV